MVEIRKIRDFYSLEDSYELNYNSLPSVDTADEELRSATAFDDFLETTRKIIFKHKLENYVGLRLIHKHFSVKAGEVMMEEFQIHKGKPALVTRPVEVEEARSLCSLPASWILSGDGNFHVFETSTDPAIQGVIDKISEEFLKEISSLLQESKMQKLMSVAVLKRDTLIGSDDQAYLEESFLEEGVKEESVVKICAQSELPELTNMVKTVWSFPDVKSSSAWCWQYCLVGPRHIKTFHRK
jgi:hypothetical protein